MQRLQTTILLMAFLALANGKPFFRVVYNAFPTPYATPYATPFIVQPTPAQAAVPVPTVKYVSVAPVSQPVQRIAVNPVFSTASRYHSQSKDGSYSFGYYGGPSSRAETRDRFGTVQGAYNYIDANGKLQSQQYVADSGGFRVAGTNLPVGPVASSRKKRSAEPEPEAAVAYGTPANTVPLNSVVSPVVVPTTYAEGVSAFPTTYAAGVPAIPSTYATSGFPALPTTYTPGFPAVPTTYTTGFHAVPTTYSVGSSLAYSPGVPTTYTSASQFPFSFFPSVHTAINSNTPLTYTSGTSQPIAYTVPQQFTYKQGTVTQVRDPNSFSYRVDA